MPVQIDLDVRVDRGLLDALGSRRTVQEPLNEELRRLGVQAEGMVKQLAVENAYDTGELARSIQSDFFPDLDGGTVVIFSDLEHAAVMEHGREPGSFPPWSDQGGEPSALALWIRRKGLDITPFQLALAIYRRGIDREGKQFFAPTRQWADERMPLVGDTILQRIRRRLLG